MACALSDYNNQAMYRRTSFSSDNKEIFLHSHDTPKLPSSPLTFISPWEQQIKDYFTNEWILQASDNQSQNHTKYCLVDSISFFTERF